MNYWLVKSEPGVYSWEDFVKEGTTAWTGIRNYAARLHLRAMKKGDIVLFYHSNKDLAIIGQATVVKEAYPDPTAKGEDWSAVDLKAGKKLKAPITLQQIKAEPGLSSMALLRISRLSVQPVTKEEYQILMGL